MSAVDRVHERLWHEAELAQLESELESLVARLVDDELPLAGEAERTLTIARVVARIRGLGRLQELAEDPTVTEIMVNGGRSVWVERHGRLERTSLTLRPSEVTEMARRTAALVGRTVDHLHPAVDVRLEDGSRLHVILPPLAVDGPCLTIRRFSDRRFELESMAPVGAVEVLQRAVERRESIVVAGATSSGKTTLLNALAAHIADTERIVTIEEAAELNLPSDHVVRLEATAPGSGPVEVGIGALIRHALRMRPDRIICGEMRGAEALDLLQAMNTGHRGSLTTVHANSAPDAVRRIETMVLAAEAAPPLAAIREHVAACLDLVVMMERRSDGRRAVTEIASVERHPDSGVPIAVRQWAAS